MSTPPGGPRDLNNPLPPLCLPIRARRGAPSPQPVARLAPLCLPVRAKPEPSLPPLCLPSRGGPTPALAPQLRAASPEPALLPDVIAPTATPAEPEEPEMVYLAPGYYMYDGELRSSVLDPVCEPREEMTPQFIDLLTTSLRTEINRLDANPHTSPTHAAPNTLPSRYPQVYQEYHRIQEENRRYSPYTKPIVRWAPDEYNPLGPIPLQEDPIQEPPQAASTMPDHQAPRPARSANPRKPCVRPPKPEDMPTWNVFRCDKPGCIFRDPRCPSLTRHVLKRPDHDATQVSVSWVGDLNAMLPPDFRSGEPVNTRFARIQAQKQARINERIARDAQQQTTQGAPDGAEGH